MDLTNGQDLDSVNGPVAPTGRIYEAEYFKEFCSRKKYQWIFAEELPKKVTLHHIKSAKDFAELGARFIANPSLLDEELEAFYLVMIRLARGSFDIQDGQQLDRANEMRNQFKKMLAKHAFELANIPMDPKQCHFEHARSILRERELDLFIEIYPRDLEVLFRGNKWPGITLDMDLKEFIKKISPHTTIEQRLSIYSSLIISSSIWEEHDFFVRLCDAIAECEDVENIALPFSETFSSALVSVLSNSNFYIPNRVAKTLDNAMEQSDISSTTLFEKSFMAELLEKLESAMPIDVFTRLCKEGHIPEERIRSRLKLDFGDDGDLMFEASRLLGNIPFDRWPDLLRIGQTFSDELPKPLIVVRERSRPDNIC